jgi:hypothetical protein
VRLNSDKLWDRLDVVYEWTRFLARAVVGATFARWATAYAIIVVPYSSRLYWWLDWVRLTLVWHGKRVHCVGE